MHGASGGGVGGSGGKGSGEGIGGVAGTLRVSQQCSIAQIQVGVVVGSRQKGGGSMGGESGGGRGGDAGGAGGGAGAGWSPDCTARPQLTMAAPAVIEPRKPQPQLRGESGLTTIMSAKRAAA